MKQWWRVIALFAVTVVAVPLLVVPGVAAWLQVLAGAWTLWALVLSVSSAYCWHSEWVIEHQTREELSHESFLQKETIRSLRCQLWHAEAELGVLRQRHSSDLRVWELVEQTLETGQGQAEVIQ